MKNPFFFIYWRMRMLEPVWRYWLNGRAARFFRTHTSRLSPIAERVLGDIKRDGIALVPMRELFSGARFQECASASNAFFRTHAFEQKVAAQKEGMARADGNKKDFFAYALGSPIGKAEPLPLSNPLILFALDEALVNLAAHYFSFAPQFVSFSLLQTLVSGGGEKAKFSQRWHRDPEDKKILKVFLYFSDVDGGTGPFSYVKKSHLGGKWRHLYPQVPPFGSYPPDGALEKVIQHEDILRCTALAGTLIFADTSGFHRGGLCTEKDRYHFVAAFASWATTQPITYLRPSVSDASFLGPLGRFAIGTSAAQNTPPLF